MVRGRLLLLLLANDDRVHGAETEGVSFGTAAMRACPSGWRWCILGGLDQVFLLALFLLLYDEGIHGAKAVGVLVCTVAVRACPGRWRRRIVGGLN